MTLDVRCLYSLQQELGGDENSILYTASVSLPNALLQLVVYINLLGTMQKQRHTVNIVS
jgi:hypothetical protein